MDKKLRHRRKLIYVALTVLDTTRWCHKPSYIFKNTKFGSTAKKYLELLSELGFVEKRSTNTTRYLYYISEKGLKLLDDYKDLMELFRKLNE